MDQAELFRLSAAVAMKLGQDDTAYFQPSTNPSQAMELLEKIPGSITMTRTAARGVNQFGVNVMRRVNNQFMWVARGDGDTLEIAICKMFLSIK